MHAEGWDCPTAAVIYTLISPSHDVTLMQILHGKSSTYFGNSVSTSHSIISRSGLESFVYTNRILIKLCRWKPWRPVIMNHRVISDLLHSRTRSECVYNGCLTCYDVLLIPRITQAWNTVVCISWLSGYVEITVRYTTPDISRRHRRYECEGGIRWLICHGRLWSTSWQHDSWFAICVMAIW